MMTLHLGARLRARRDLHERVDTGWVTDEDPVAHAVRKREEPTSSRRSTSSTARRACSIRSSPACSPASTPGGSSSRTTGHRLVSAGLVNEERIMTRFERSIPVALLAVGLAGAAAHASAGDFRLAVEGGVAWQTRNDFRIPGEGGTLVELADYDSGPGSVPSGLSSLGPGRTPVAAPAGRPFENIVHLHPRGACGLPGPRLSLGAARRFDLRVQLVPAHLVLAIRSGGEVVLSPGWHTEGPGRPDRARGHPRPLGEGESWRRSARRRLRPLPGLGPRRPRGGVRCPRRAPGSRGGRVAEGRCAIQRQSRSRYRLPTP